MKNRLFLMGYLSLLLILFSAANYSQSGGEVGKIITTAQANQLFGPVLKSEKFKTKNLELISRNSNGYIMFGFKNNKLFILDKSRKVLHPKGETVQPDEIFSVYSTSKLLELFTLGKGNHTYIELRGNNILTITNYDDSGDGPGDGFSMDFANACPPFEPH